ncbi:MAG: hypothetical protein K2Y39_25725 [Candidatus Obscuribacterales bacterium]|nr:hypothetical protein [Candidatus Obscuribacterales bacterium]
MNNLVAFGLGDAWQNSAGHVHSHNCGCRKAQFEQSNQFVAELMNALEINPLYFGPDDPEEPNNFIQRVIII